MEAIIAWKPDDRVVDCVYRGAIINTPRRFQEWKELIFPQFDDALRQAGGRFPLIVCIDELEIHPALASRYGMEVARVVGSKYATSIARYGHRTTVRAVIAVEAMRSDYKANLFERRSEAIQHVLGLAEVLGSSRAPLRRSG